jgi:hypothetical protein
MRRRPFVRRLITSRRSRNDALSFTHMPSRASVLALVLCVAAFVCLAIGNIVTTSPTYDEPFHLAAGYTQLTTGDHRFGPDHPPLFRSIAALPLLAMNLWPNVPARDDSHALSMLAKTWSLLPVRNNAAYMFEKQLFFGLRDSRFGTPTTVAATAQDFLNDATPVFRRARLMMLFTSGVLLAIVIFCWSFEVWGPWAAVWSALLFCFDPNFIAHSGLVTTDVPAAMLMFSSMYFFWRATRQTSIANVLAFGLSFTAALLAKYSSVLLLPMFALTLVWGRERARRVAIVAVSVVIAFIGIWAMYGFRFRASAVNMPVHVPVTSWYATIELLNRYPGGPPAGTPYATSIPVGIPGRLMLVAEKIHLLPQPYLYGFAEMRSRSIVRGTFLRGTFGTLGFKSYFLWTFLYKTPLVTILAIIAGLTVAIRTRNAVLPYLLLPVVIYGLVSITSGLNIGHRHLLPVYPFLYLLSGSLAASRFRRALVFAAPVVVISSMVVLAPWQPVVNQHLAYFNELAGGPEHGRELLIDSNIDWGQDLPRLATWLREHNVSEPINLVYFGTADPRAYGIRYVNLQGGYLLEPPQPLSAARVPGLLAISANAFASPNTNRHDVWPNALRNAKLVGKAGYSILIYRIEQPLDEISAKN